MKKMQNSICRKMLCVGMKKGEPVFIPVTVVSTRTRVIVYGRRGLEIGQAGVKREKDFDFDALYNIALKESGKSIVSIM